MNILIKSLAVFCCDLGPNLVVASFPRAEIHHQAKGFPRTRGSAVNKWGGRDMRARLWLAKAAAAARMINGNARRARHWGIHSYEVARWVTVPGGALTVLPLAALH